jgi:calmodulin
LHLWLQPVLVMTTLGERMSHDEVDALLRAVDTDHNGGIDYEEFVKMMMNG